MAAVTAHRFIAWPPHRDEDGWFVVKVGLESPTRAESCTTIGCSIRSRVYPSFSVNSKEVQYWPLPQLVPRPRQAHERVDPQRATLLSMGSKSSITEGPFAPATPSASAKPRETAVLTAVLAGRLRP